MAPVSPEPTGRPGRRSACVAPASVGPSSISAPVARPHTRGALPGVARADDRKRARQHPRTTLASRGLGCPRRAHERSGRTREAPGSAGDDSIRPVARALRVGRRNHGPRRAHDSQASSVSKHRCNSIRVRGTLGRGTDRHDILRWPETTGQAHPAIMPESRAGAAAGMIPATAARPDLRWSGAPPDGRAPVHSQPAACAAAAPCPDCGRRA